MKLSGTHAILFGFLVTAALVACGEDDATNADRVEPDASAEQPERPRVDASTERADASPRIDASDTTDAADATAPLLDPACAVAAGCYEIVESAETVSAGGGGGDGVCSPSRSETRYGTLPFTDPREPANAWCTERKPGAAPVPTPEAPECTLAAECNNGQGGNFTAHAQVDVDTDGVTMVLTYGHDGPGAGCRFTTVATKVDDALCADAGL